MKKPFLAGMLTLALAFALPSQAKEVHGKQFAPQISVSGKSLKLLGAGTRVKWVVPVYAMGAYSASGRCDRNTFIVSDEVKSLRIVMLRDVSSKDMTSAISEALGKVMPSKADAALVQKRKTFEGFFKHNLGNNTRLDMDYVPGKGLSVSQNGKSLGMIPGSDFAQVFFGIYFSSKTCCPELQKDIMQCK